MLAWFVKRSQSTLWIRGLPAKASEACAPATSHVPTISPVAARRLNSGKGEVLAFRLPGRDELLGDEPTENAGGISRLRFDKNLCSALRPCQPALSPVSAGWPFLGGELPSRSSTRPHVIDGFRITAKVQRRAVLSSEHLLSAREWSCHLLSITASLYRPPTMKAARRTRNENEN